MRASVLAVGCLAILAGAVAASAKPVPAAVFKEWQTAYNATDPTGMADFSTRYLGGEDMMFWRDVRQETGPLELVRVEKDGPDTYSAILKEANGGALRRFSITCGKDSPPCTLDGRGLPMAQADAIANMAQFADRLTAADQFSGIIAISHKGRVLFQQAYGLADRNAGVKMGLDTPMLFASQGKMLTGVAILQLVEAGKVALDAPLSTYLPDYPNKEMAKVTIRQMLTHTGGTGDMGILQADEGPNRAKVNSIADILVLNGSRAPDFPPGSKMDYSNYGFILLGAVVEKASGQDYYNYVRTHVLEPAGMKHTSWPLLGQMKGVAIPYTTKEDGKLAPALDQLPWRGTPAGGGVTTVADELRFAKALQAGTLLSPAMVVEATRQQTEWYGYGFVSSGPAEFPHWGHGGVALGTSMAFAVYPTADLTIACMANRDAPICDRLLFNLHFHLAPDVPAKGN